MFRFLLGVAFGAGGYWAWQSFGRDLLGLGNDQDTYGGYSGSTSFGSGTSTGNTIGSSGTSSSVGGSAATPSTAPTETPSAGTT